MANCSIPNWTRATGRTSTPSSRPLRKQNSEPACFSEVIILSHAIGPWAIRFFNTQRSTFKAQRSIQIVGRWTLVVGRWAFSSFGRVKGAWWPSRSSKPLSVSHTRDRGRFDSYPLRLPSLVILSGAKRNRKIPWNYRWVPPRDSSTSLGMTSNPKGGDR
jgi:hypothetical protein